MSNTPEEIRTTSATGGQKGVKPERYDLIPVGPLAELAKLYGFGAEKYSEHNWRKGFEWSKSYAAMQRHANQFWNGEDTDPETGCSHLASVIFHAMCLMEFTDSHLNYDDRYVAPQTSKDDSYLPDDRFVTGFTSVTQRLNTLREELNASLSSVKLPQTPQPRNGENADGD